MVNSRAKGRKTVRKGKEILESLGWIFGELERRGKFITEKDLFGLFDNCAVKNKTWLFIQFKTNRMPRLDEYIAFAKRHASEHVHIEIWVWYDRKGFKITRIDEDGNTTTRRNIK